MDRRSDNQRFEALSLAPVGSCVLDKDRTVLFWSSLLEQWTGHSSRQIVGRNIADYYTSFDQRWLTGRLDAIFEGGPPAIFSAQLHDSIFPSRLPNGAPRVQHTIVTAIRSEDRPGESLALLSVQDVTDLTQVVQRYRSIRDKALEEVKTRQKAEAKLRDSERRYRALSERLQLANEQLQQLDHLKTMFIASMSHELRTPLNSIIGFSEMILADMAGAINAEQRDYLQRVHAAGQHLLGLITEVIDISKIEAGKMSAVPVDFALAPAVNEAISAVQRSVDDKQLSLRAAIPADLSLHTDRKRLLQCLINYLDNAVKYTEQGSIEIGARQADNIVEITVKDSGIGIPADELSHIFDAFVRVDSPLHSQVEGTGLGLYLTQKIVTDLLGGTVSVESGTGTGSTFTLRIPAHRA